MVEGLKYYQDTPDKEQEKEAIAIDRSGDDYYRPFFNNPKKVNWTPTASQTAQYSSGSSTGFTGGIN